MTASLVSIILAAGHSRRMGGHNKLLAVVAEKAMLRHVADHVLAADIGPVYVVTGHQAARTRKSLCGLPVQFIHNSQHEMGLASSVRCGIGNLSDAVDGAMIVLGDMPLVQAVTIRALANEFADTCSAVVPTMNGKRGNPVLWHRRMFPALLALEGDQGARHLLADMGESLHMCKVKDPGIFLDADDPQALSRIRILLHSDSSR